MTVLSAFQSAAIRVIGQRPASLFSSTDKFALEMADLVNESAKAIAKAHEWQALMASYTLTGDGSTDAFDLPSDYDRMPVKSEIWMTGYRRPLRRAVDLDEWRYFQIYALNGWPGFWILMNKQIQVVPAPATGNDGKVYYLSNLIVSPETGSNKTDFTVDTDTFRLPERLLTLSLIWRWRAQKRLEYAEDMHNFEIAMEEECGRDKGNRILHVGQKRMGDHVDIAYPGSILP